jgi:HD-GYP domain-containing protein (c-di-GMP phosphodiesterase class II)
MRQDQELSESDLNRLNRFNIRQIVVESSEVRWVKEEELDDLSDAEVLDTREVQEAEPSEVKPFSQTGSIKRFRDYLQSLDLESDQDYSDFVNELYELDDRREDIFERLNDVLDDDDLIASITNQLSGSTVDLDEIPFDEMPDSLVNEVVKWVNDRRHLEKNASEAIEASGEENYEAGESDAPLSTVDSVRTIFGQLNDLEDDMDEETFQDTLRQTNEFEQQLEDILKWGYKDASEELREQVKEILTGDETLDSIDVSEDASEPLLNKLKEFQNKRKRLASTVEDSLPEDIEDLNDLTDRNSSSSQSDTSSKEDGSKAPIDSREDFDTLDEEVIEEVTSGREVTSKIIGKLKALDAKLSKLERNEISLEEQIDSLDSTEEKGQLEEFLNDPSSTPDIDPSDDSKSAELMNDILDHHTHRYESEDQLLDQIHQNDSRNDDDSLPENLKADLDEIRRSTGAGLSADLELDTEELKESEPSDESSGESLETRIGEAFDEGASLRLSELSGLPEDFVRTAMTLLDIDPLSLSSGKRQKLLQRVQTFQRMILFEARYDTEVFETLKKDFLQLFSGETYPVKLLIRPDTSTGLIPVHGFNNMTLLYSVLEDLNLDESTERTLELSALMTDFGLSGVPHSTIEGHFETSGVMGREYSKHPLYSARLVERVDGLPETIADSVRTHHERINGSGYPLGLGKNDITANEELVRLVERYTELFENRANTDEPNPPEIARQLATESDQFIPEVFQQFITTIGYYPDGSVVMLEDGRMGIVKQQSEDDPENPTVVAFTDSNQNKVNPPQSVQLDRQTVGVKKYLKR